MGAYTGPSAAPRTLLLGRYDTDGRLRFTGRTATLPQSAGRAVAALLTSAPTPTAWSCRRPGWSLLWKIGHLPEPRHHTVSGRLPLWQVDDIDAYGTCDYERWTISQVADHLGYQGTSAAGTARKQMSRWGLDAVGRAPGRGGESLYAAVQVQAAHAARPGKGRHGVARSEGGRFT
ncbi:hypothetical protein [Streptomyces sp. CA-251251]|uniref:hypothetical protein n=1 Tax=Streptomyces sp. CA-251251 TaxID=3240063 RepID=UPI003D915B44